MAGYTPPERAPSSLETAVEPRPCRGARAAGWIPRLPARVSSACPLRGVRRGMSVGPASGASVGRRRAPSATKLLNEESE